MPPGHFGRDLQLDSKVPDPNSPAALHLHLSHEQKRHLKSQGSTKPALTQYAEIHEVLCAIASILNDGEIPDAIPPKYKDALQELDEAREDRTEKRLERFDHAIQVLHPALVAADARHSLSVVKNNLKIDGLIATWRMVCSWGPAALPAPIGRAKYEYIYVALGGETITEVALQFGHPNADPLARQPYAYAPNMHLAKGDNIYVPFPRYRLENYIEAAETVIERTTEGLKEELEKVHMDKENLESLLIKVDAIFFLLNMANAVTEGVELGFKVTKTMAKHYAKKITEETVEWGKKEGIKTGFEILSMAMDTSGAPKKGVALLIRHATVIVRITSGWVNYNYWASLVAAVASGEYEVFLRGPEGIEQKRAAQLIDQTSRYIEDLKGQIRDMKNQLKSNVYLPRRKE